MKILKTPWKKEFLELIKNSKANIRITSPYIKESICQEIINTKNEEAKINLITSFKIKNIYNGSLDLNGLETLINNKSVVKNRSDLHSKIYIFDDRIAIISSSNLTNGGLLTNYEYGILLNDKKIVYEIIDDFDTLFTDENIGIITADNLFSVKKILSKLPKVSTVNIPEFSLNNDIFIDDVIEIESNYILETLTGWKKEVFIILNDLDKQYFRLEDVYFYEQKLSNIYPQNKNIKDKIRQQLQKLRDLGLIEFLGNGKYRKLWK